MKLEQSPQIFEKYSYIKFQENSSSASWVFHVGGRTDRQEKANSLFLEFCKLAQKQNNDSYWQDRKTHPMP